MTPTTRRIVPALLAGIAALALSFGVAACGGSDSSGTGSAVATTTTTTTASDSATGRPVLAQGTGFDPQAIYSEAAPSVVTILSIIGDAADPTSAGQGSGFVINDNGEIVTNAHVVTDATEAGGGQPINEADEVYVEFGDRTRCPRRSSGPTSTPTSP